MHVPRKLLLTALGMLLSGGSILAQQTAQPAAPPPNPCIAPQQKQFDFWVGDWDLSWPNPKGDGTLHGANHIHRVLNDCIVQENFDGGGNPPFRGMSVSVFSPQTGKWQQTWVDNQGSYLDFSGEFKDGQMILSRSFTGPDGKSIAQRMVYKNIQPDQLDWSWERSSDGGKTWQVMWPVHYTRKKTS